MKLKKIQHGRKQRAARVRRSVINASDKMRVSVFRSLTNIYAQLIDDKNQKTIISSTSLKVENKKNLDKKEVAKLVGIDLAKKALAAKVEEACFDRGRYLYHGRVKSLAEGLREGGLRI